MELGRAKDIRGNRYGHWTVLERAENGKNGTLRWLCKCDCGTIRSVDANHLKRGDTTNCGCIARANTSWRNIFLHRTHGGTTNQFDRRLYNVYLGIHKRCEKPYSKNYRIYGARGIKVCDEWSGEHGYENFREWAVPAGYDPYAPRGKCTLDRIDNDGDYSPENCRWVDAKEQGNNRRDNHMITYNEETLTLTEWADRYGLKPVTLTKRLRDGWSVEKALTTPVDKTKRNKRAFAYGT